MDDVQVYYSGLLKERFEGKFTDRFVRLIEESPSHFDSFYQLILHEDHTISWRAAWVCKKLSERHRSWFLPMQHEITAIVLKPETYQGTRHQLINILNDLPLELPLNVGLLNYCLERMTHPDEPVSIQALCMKIAYRMCCQEPELLHEFWAIVNQTDSSYFSPGLKAVIRKLNKKKS